MDCFRRFARLNDSFADVDDGILQYWLNRSHSDHRAQVQAMRHISNHNYQGRIADAILDKLIRRQSDSLRFLQAAGRLDLYYPEMEIHDAIGLLQHRQEREERAAIRAMERNRRRTREDDEEDSGTNPSRRRRVL